MERKQAPLVRAAIPKAVKKCARAFFRAESAAEGLFGKRSMLYEKVWWGRFISNRAFGLENPHELQSFLSSDGRQGIFPKKLLEHIELMNEGGTKILSVLELGPGPLSNLAYGVEAGLIKVVAVDPLANFYSKELEKQGISYPVKPIKGTGEDLKQALANGNKFDIAYAANSLDHTEYPWRCIQNITDSLRVGGILFISGTVKEGTRTGWIGLHKHDFVPENGSLIDYLQNGERIDLACQFPLRHVSSQIFERGGKLCFEIVFRKIQGD